MDTPLNIPAFNSYELDLPAWFAVPTRNFGDPKKPVWWSLANPTTNTRNLSTRKHQHSIDINRKVIDKPALNEWDELPRAMTQSITLEHFAPIDQARIEKMEEHEGESYANHPALSRGRPEVLPKNVEYMRHHKHHDQVKRYGSSFLEKVKAVQLGKPIVQGEESAHPSPSSSRTPTARTPSRLSNLARSLQSFSPANESESSSDSESESEDEDVREARRQADRSVFGRNPLGSSSSGSSSSGSSKSRSSRSSRPSVSRGKPPLKRPEPKPRKIAGTTAPKPKPKKTKPAVELVIEEPVVVETPSPTVPAPTVPAPPKPKGKTKWAKPTSSQGDVPLVQKARGRKPKYATKQEAYLAKLEQNKIGKQKKAEAKKKAQTDGAGITISPSEMHMMPDGTIMAGATHKEPADLKKETQEERRFKMEEQQRKKHADKLFARTEKLRIKEEKRLAKVLVDSAKPAKKPRKPRAKKGDKK